MHKRKGTLEELQEPNLPFLGSAHSETSLSWAEWFTQNTSGWCCREEPGREGRIPWVLQGWHNSLCVAGIAKFPGCCRSSRIPWVLQGFQDSLGAAGMAEFPVYCREEPGKDGRIPWGLQGFQNSLGVEGMAEFPGC